MGIKVKGRKRSNGWGGGPVPSDWWHSLWKLQGDISAFVHLARRKASSSTDGICIVGRFLKLVQIMN